MLAGLSKSSGNQSNVHIALICTALAVGAFTTDVASLPLGVATKGLQLKLDSQSEIALSDSTLLARIVRILLSNAIRYTSQGFVEVGCRRVPDGLRVTVRDSGIGIAADHLPRIFDEFYRVENDPAGRDGGLGLGLAIVERSVKLLGTTMEVDSEPGQGSSFSLVAPAEA